MLVWELENILKKAVARLLCPSVRIAKELADEGKLVITSMETREEVRCYQRLMQGTWEELT